MKKVILLIFITLFCFKLQAQLLEPGKQVYKSEHLKDAIKSHHIVAILPLDAHITYRKTPRYEDSVFLSREEMRLGEQVQFDIYNAMLREFFKYKVKFQSTFETNRLLQQSGMAENLNTYNKAEIAKALGVDAVIFGEYQRKINSASAGTVAAAVVGYDKTAEVTITLNIANGKDGELLWSYAKRMNEMGTPEAKDVFERQMEKLTRNLPYTRGVFKVL